MKLLKVTKSGALHFELSDGLIYIKKILTYVGFTLSSYGVMSK